MADYELPQDLVDLKRAFLAADADCEAIANALPSNVAVLNAEADRDESGQAHLVARRSERIELVELINRHPWWGTLGGEERYKASLALLNAAKTSSSAAPS